MKTHKSFFPGGSRPFMAFALFGLAVFVASCPRFGLRPVHSIHLSEYIEMFIPRPAIGDPEFPYVLEIAPVAMEMKLRTAYDPDRAFKGKFVDELRGGAITFFDRKAMFTTVRESGGDLKMAIQVLSYEASRSSNPQKMLLKLEVSLIDLKHHKTVLYGKAGSQTIIPINQLDNIINLAPPGGGRNIAIQRGALEMSVMCVRIFGNIEAEIRKNKKHILKSVEL